MTAQPVTFTPATDVPLPVFDELQTLGLYHAGMSGPGLGHRLPSHDPTNRPGAPESHVDASEAKRQSPTSPCPEGRFIRHLRPPPPPNNPAQLRRGNRELWVSETSQVPPSVAAPVSTSLYCRR